jgi:hypothetical protein
VSPAPRHPRGRRIAVALGTLAAAAVLAGCGQSDAASAPAVAWDGKPLVVHQAELPDDTIVSGKLRNGSGARLELDAGEVRILDADGHALRSTARFSAAVSHSLYPPGDGPSEAKPLALRKRLGEVATVEPGESVPLVVSWRQSHGEPPPVRVDLGSATLKLPGS